MRLVNHFDEDIEARDFFFLALQADFEEFCLITFIWGLLMTAVEIPQ